MKPTGLAPELLVKHYEFLLRVADRYHADAAFRRSLELDGRNVLGDMGLEFPDGMEVRVVANSRDRLYLAMPPNLNIDLGDQVLAAVAGGFKSVGTAASFGSVGSVCTCAGTFMSAGTLGTSEV